MTIPVGYHKIRTSSGKYLTLLTYTGIVTAMPESGATNQTWNFQPSGDNWIINNNGCAMSIFAYSDGQLGAPVTGNPLSTEWVVFPFSDVYLIKLATNISNAWSVDANNHVGDNPCGVTQPQNPAQQFSIE